MNDQEIYERVSKAERLLQEVEALPDPKARNTAVAALQALLELYGEALVRILKSSEQLAGEPLLQAFAEDELVAHLLLVHDLHPMDLQARVQRALAEVQPYLQSQGGDVQLLTVHDGVVHLKLLGSCNGCGASTAGLKTAVTQAVYELAPEVTAIEMAEDTATSNNFVPLASLLPGVELHG